VASSIAGTRITFVVDGALDQQTGGYLYDRIIVEGLRARGADVRVVGLEASSLARSARSALQFVGILDQALAEGHVVVDELCHPRVVVGALLARRRGRRAGKLVTLVHHLAANERRGFAARARLVVESALLAASDLVVVTSETTRAAVLSAGEDPSRVRVVVPGRDRLGGRADPPMRRENTLRLLFVGALTPRKDPLALLETIAQVENVSLTLAGPADRDPVYAALVFKAASRLSSRVRVLGEVSDAELTRLYADHDVLVLPSRYEGFGIVLAEAMNHGLGIVATRAGAIPETIGPGGAGILVDPGDPRALERTLRDLAGAPERVRAMQRRALARAIELPTWADAQLEFAAALSSMATEGRETPLRQP
jgi:glycosyltransferase involved in cell wall biosynthesis